MEKNKKHLNHIQKKPSGNVKCRGIKKERQENIDLTNEHTLGINAQATRGLHGIWPFGEDELLREEE